MDITATEQQRAQGLTGNIGTGSLFFTVLAYTAPLAASVGFLPVIVAFGNQLGAPDSIIIAGVILALFSVGFLVMSKRLAKPGGFYAFITAGLGRVPGLGASFIATVSYFFLLIGNYAYGGITLEALVHDTFHGPDVKWWVWILVFQVAVGVLGYLRLELSARVLSVLLAAEILIVLVYDAFVVGKGGASGLSATSFTPHAAVQGSLGLGLMFAVTGFGGFEATVIFREEVRTPDRTIPRATYLVVGVITVLYTLGTWAFVQAYGNAHVVSAAQDPTGSFLASVTQYVGKAGYDVVTVLVNTSIFACGLSAHSITSRYVYNLSSDKILPAPLSAVHHKHGSPYRASILVSVLAFAALGLLAILGANPTTLYAQLIGVYGYSLVILLLVATVAVAAYLWRRRTAAGVTPWNSLVTPVLAFIGLAIVAYLSTKNFATLLSGSQDLANGFLIAFYAIAALGCALALVFRRLRPDTYARIGRQ